MPTISRSALVEHSAKSMFELVCDIEAYPEFLPWCNGARVDEQSDTHQLAAVSTAAFMKQSTFCTRNRLESDRLIAMELVDGPFKQLSGEWRFTELSPDACKIELDIEFEFASTIVGKMLGPAFNTVCDTLVSAFIKRADQLAARKKS